jgi:predicted nucleic acid-binding Zn ribbon protein
MTKKRKRMFSPMAVSNLLGDMFRGKPLEKRLHEGKIWHSWDSVVGTQIAAQARPVNFRDGILTVVVGNAPWMQQLNYMKKGIAEKLNAALGEDLVKEIYLKAGRPEPLPAEPQLQQRSVRPLTDSEKESIARETADINDPELREALAHLLKTHLVNSTDKS